MSFSANMTLGRDGIRRAVCATIAACLSAVIASGLGGCAADPQPFASPDAALDSLVTALRTDNEADLTRILGPQSKDLLSSGDEVADANGRATFLRLFDAKHRLVADGDDVMNIEVGENDWPLPVPLVKGDNGWFFDTAAGIDEALSRRIGRNELYVIQVVAAIADAERDYAAADFSGDGWREYAQQFNSDPGKKNGLYWPSAPGQPESPLGSLVVSATEEGYKQRDPSAPREPRPYHGYYYRILTSQGPAAPGGTIDYVIQGHMIGGFAVIAWPADYANSGLKSFIVNHNEIVYEKDLGDDTDSIARAMKAFNPDAGWVKSDMSIKP